MCQDYVCLCARVPRRRQTLAALSELTGPSPLPLLVAQGGRQRKRGEMEDTVVLTNCLYISKHMMCIPYCTRKYIIMKYLHRKSSCTKQFLYMFACWPQACKNARQPNKNYLQKHTYCTTHKHTVFFSKLLLPHCIHSMNSLGVQKNTLHISSTLTAMYCLS